VQIESDAACNNSLTTKHNNTESQLEKNVYTATVFNNSQ